MTSTRRSNRAAGGVGVAMGIAALFMTVLAGPAHAQSADSRMTRLSDEFIQRALTRHPQLATRLGIHDYDDLLYPVTEASMEEDAVWLRGFRTRLAELPRVELSFGRALD